MNKRLYFLFILLFISIYSQIKQNPIFLIESTNPLILSTNPFGYNLKINKESG